MTAEDIAELPGRVCVHCGRQVAPQSQRFCHNCNLLLGPEGSLVRRYAELDRAPAAFVRLYPAHRRSTADAALKTEAELFYKLGYEPGEQAWQPGRRGRAGTLLLFKGDGMLTVTFLRVDDGDILLQPASPTATARLGQLQRAREAGLLSEDEYFHKRAEVVAAL